MLTRTRRKTSAWNLFFQYSVVIYNIVIGLVLVPMYLKFIPAELYGAWLATGNIVAWLTLVDPGFSALLQQKVAFHYGKKEFILMSNYVFNGIILTSIFSLILLIVGLIISTNFTVWLNIALSSQNIEQLVSSFIIVVIANFLLLNAFSIDAINQGLQSSLAIGMIFTINNIIGVLITIYLLYAGYGLLSIPIGMLWRGVAQLIGGAFYTAYRFKKESLPLTFRFNHMKEVLKLSFFNFLGKFSGVISNQFNAFLIARYLGALTVTVFRFSSSAPDMSKLILVRPINALTPALTYLYGEKGTDSAQSVILRLFNYIIWGSGLAFVGFYIFNESFVTLWVGKEFYGGWLLNLLICLTLIAGIVSETLYKIVYVLGDMKKSNVVLFIYALIFIVLAYFGVKHFGLEGIISAALISITLITLPYYIYSFIKMNKLTINELKNIIKELFKVLVLISGLIFLFRMISIENWLQFMYSSIALVITYFTLLAIFSSLLRAELKTLVSSIYLRLLGKV